LTAYREDLGKVLEREMGGRVRGGSQGVKGARKKTLVHE